MEGVENKRFIYEFEDFVLDPQDKTLLFRGRAIHLTPKELQTLVLLVENNGRALSKQEMMTALWEDAFVEESNLAKQISQLRKVFNSKGSKLIETVPKHGYRFKAELSHVEVKPDSEVVFAARTVKRLTVAAPHQPDEKPFALAPARRSFSRTTFVMMLIGGLGIVLFGMFFGRQLFSPNPVPIDPYAPIRLTDNPNDDTGPQWTKDGRIRFWRVYPDHHSEAWTMNADGSEQTLIKDPPGRQVVSWSPDESKIIYIKSGEPGRSYVSNADGSGETLLPGRGGEWSSDSKMLVYMQRVSGDNFDIFTYSIESGKITNITNSPAFDADPSFSPDGRTVVFDSDRDGNQEIYAVNIDGSGLRRLTFDPAGDNHPAYSPDGTQIIFTSGRDNENADVFVMNTDGSNPVNLTKWDKTNETAGVGSWSPDGTGIAFFSDRNGKDDIYVMSAETIRSRVVLAEPDHDLRVPSFSPDGRRIAYSREDPDKSGELRILDLDTKRSTLVKKTELAVTPAAWSPSGEFLAFHDRVSGNSEIFKVRLDGSDRTRLTTDPAPDTGPSWSADGSKIVFQSARGEPLGKPQLYVMDEDGSDQRPLTRQKGWETDPVWAPDGHVIFACDREDSPGNMLDICEINSDGTGEKRILFHKDHDTDPAVSPDGKRVAFVSNSDGNAEIYIMNRDGTGLLRLTRNPADDQWPHWSPDGKSIIFGSNRTGRYAIYEIDAP